MKFTKEQQDFIKNASQHAYLLTGGRGHSKTKELIESLQQELDQYKNNWEELKTYLNMVIGMNFNMNNDKLSEQTVDDYTDILNKMKELEEDK